MNIFEAIRCLHIVKFQTLSHRWLPEVRMQLCHFLLKISKVLHSVWTNRFVIGIANWALVSLLPACGIASTPCSKFGVPTHGGICYSEIDSLDLLKNSLDWFLHSSERSFFGKAELPDGFGFWLHQVIKVIYTNNSLVATFLCSIGLARAPLCFKLQSRRITMLFSKRDAFHASSGQLPQLIRFTAANLANSTQVVRFLCHLIQEPSSNLLQLLFVHFVCRPNRLSRGVHKFLTSL
mmetsp:Transcript_22828/g.44371  ORF Transcript_22828/g.44371 Transcript_22828/m.44371 type:complete len:236 (-) Transcript_22828:536-1243(-)